jgi:hypothetical protein
VSHQPWQSRALSLQVWRFVAIKIWIIPAEHNTLESVRLLNDRTRNLPSLNLKKIDEAVYGVGDVAVKKCSRQHGVLGKNGYAERIIGSIRRECLNHVIVINEWHLRQILKSYFGYYHRSRTHLSLDKDAPEPRPVQDL